MRPFVSDAIRRHPRKPMTSKTQSLDVFLSRSFEAQAARTPDAPAVIFSDVVYSFKETNDRASTLAAILRKSGVGPDVLVGVFAERSFNLVVSILAVLKAGGAYVPIDPAYPEQRICRMLDDSDARVILTDSHSLPKLPRNHSIIFDLDGLDWSRDCPTHEEHLTGSPDDLAYVIYTSGSTGQPNGVMISHRAICNHMEWMLRTFEFGPGDRVLQRTSISFDASVWEFFAPLLSGGTLVLAPPASRADPGELVRLIRKHCVTVLQAVPSLLHLLTNEPEFRECGTLRLQFCGGERLSRTLAENFRATLPQTRLVNLYGPTEATIDATFWELKNSIDSHHLPIGTPIDNMRVYIVDDDMGPVADMERGEILIGGPGVARGYLNNPELTARKFIPNPFEACGQNKVYRTGDIGRLLPDGTIEFLGRNDDQIKFSGYRIELGEIEATLASHPHVDSAAVAVAGGTESPFLAAAFVPSADATVLNDRILRNFLVEKLPVHMLPSRFVSLDRLPLMPNGKIDRNGVAALAGGDCPEDTRENGALDLTLKQIWCETLHTKEVSGTDNFFTLGGNSLAVGQVLTRIRDRLGVSIKWSEFYAAPTISGLTRLIGGAEKATDESILISKRSDNKAEFPLSSAQQRVWFVEQVERDNRAYRFQSVIHLRGQLDLPALEKALTTIVERHTIFRTTFHVRDGSPFQRVEKSTTVALPVTDFRHLPKDQREERSVALRTFEFSRGFDLEKGPPVRWSLHRMEDDYHRLLHQEHHLVHDGWSFQIFLSELAQLYTACSTGGPSPLVDTPVQFGDFALAELNWLQSQAARDQLDYWRKNIRADLPPLPLPYDHARPSKKSYNGSAIYLEIPLTVCRDARELCRREGVSLYSVFLAGFHALLHRCTGESWISTGCGIANRKSAETEGVIGMLVNNVVVQSDLSESQPFINFVRNMLHRIVAAHENSDIPFDRVVAALGATPNLSFNPLFQVMFSFHDSPLPDVRIPRLKLDVQNGVGNESAKFDLNIIVIPHSRQLVELGSNRDPESVGILWEFSTDLFTRETIARLASLFERFLHAAVLNPDANIGEIPLTSTEELLRIESWSNGPRSKLPGAGLIHEVFEEHARKHPCAIALLEDGRSLTYRELDKQADSLKSRLLATGEINGRFVGVHIGRSIEFVVATLAILKSGAAYLPINTSEPEHRIRLMLRDANPVALLSVGEVPAWVHESVSAVIDLTKIETSPAGGRCEPPAATSKIASAESPAYLMYTSGSTGTPKGVVVPHRGVVRLVHGQTYAKFDGGGRFLFLASPAFDAATFEIWGPLLNGSTCVIFSPRWPDLEELERVIRSNGVTCLWLTAGLFNQIVDQRPGVLASVEHVITGGDVLSTPHVRRAFDLMPGLKITNGYGPTESTTFACTHDISREPLDDSERIPIGRPIANTSCTIMDSAGQIAPVGIAGELLIGGLGLATGYLNDNVLTQKRFVDLTAPSGETDRYYRTGDRCRWLPDGSIDFLGRVDNQVKIRGFRIEPGEIETVLSEDPEVKQAAVIVEQRPEREKRLICFVVSRNPSNAKHLSGEIRDRTAKRLPDYMMPSHFVMLEQMPLTPNGKVDRKSLAQLTPTNVEEASNEPNEEPSSPTEQVLAKIWRGVLQLNQVGVRQNFFAIGGHSLAAMTTLTRLRDDHQVSVSIKDFFEYPTIRSLGELIDSQNGANDKARQSSAGRERHEEGFI